MVEPIPARSGLASDMRSDCLACLVNSVAQVGDRLSPCRVAQRAFRRLDGQPGSGLSAVVPAYAIRHDRQD